MINHEDGEKKSDVELVGLSLENPDWFFFLIKRYEEKLLWYISRISKFSREDAGDVLQEVFIKTYYSLNEFDKELKFSSWIYRIAHNQTVSKIRKRSSRPTVFLEEGDMEKFEYGVDLIDSLENKIDREKINKALSLLDSKYSEVLALRFLDEKDYTEIADILKKPVSTVGNLISRGKKLFRVEYEKLINYK